MQRAEYWLLDAAILTGVRVRLLHPDNCELEDAFNRRQHGLTLPELVDNLHTLFQRGDIVALHDTPHDSDPGLFLPTYDHIMMTLRDKQPNLHYLLTARGGACWEGVTHADWQRFTRVDEGHQSELREVVIAAGSRYILAELVRLYPFLDLNHEVLDNTLVWDEIQPWPATYWKTLPIGYCVTFRTIPRHDYSSSHYRQLVQQYQIHQQQWVTATQWYTTYLEQ